MSTTTETAVERKTNGAPQPTVLRPRVDIYQSEARITILANLPGADESSTRLEVTGDVLELHADVAAQADAAPIVFKRRFTLSDQIDRERIEAQVKHGLLTLMLPIAGPQVKKIQIQGG